MSKIVDAGCIELQESKAKKDPFSISLEVIEKKHFFLTEHPLYSVLHEKKSLQIFMESHIFAVWDFMSLLKSLQIKLTSVQIPWLESIYPSHLVRLINEIVLVEESDEDERGGYSSHFSLYLRAMEEVGASQNRISSFLRDRDYSILYPEERDFVRFTLDLSHEGRPEEVASSFFFGREKLIPSIFECLLGGLGEDQQNRFPALRHYLKRHIEVDGEQHGPHAWNCLQILCENDSRKWNHALLAAERSLDLRIRLWDGAYQRITRPLS